MREGVYSFGAPVFDASGQAVAGVAVCINKALLGADRGERHREAALAVARTLVAARSAASRAAAPRRGIARRGGALVSGDLILETRELTKEFKGFVAVSKVNLQVRRGSIHALIGPNGAGKTTCFNLLTKFLTPTSRPDRVRRRRHHPRGAGRTSRAAASIRSFQISAVFPHLTVLENVRVALQRKLGTSFHFWKPERSAARARRARDRAAARGRPRRLCAHCRRSS